MCEQRVLASLRISGHCVEMMSFNGYMIGGNYCSISTLIAYAWSLWPYAQVYLVACSTLRALLPAYLVGLEPLGLFFVWASVYHMHRLSLCALRHNIGSDVCASSKCPGETVHLPRLVWVVDSHIYNRLVCLISWHVFQKVFAISCLKWKRFRAWRSRF